MIRKKPSRWICKKKHLVDAYETSCPICGEEREVRDSKGKIPERKSVAALKKELQVVFNAWIRKRDTLPGGVFKCISCGTVKDVKHMHAGHFFSVGAHEAVRFDEDNAAGQCEACNTFLHGNLILYRENLIKKIGIEKFNKIDLRKHNLSKMGAFELSLLIQEYKAKLKSK